MLKYLAPHIKTTGLLYALLYAIDNAIDRSTKKDLHMALNAMPQYTTMLDEWDNAMRMPHLAYIKTPERQRRIIAETRRGATMAKDSLQQLLQSAGFEVYVHTFAYGENPNAGRLVQYPTQMSMTTYMAIDTQMAIPEEPEIIANGNIEQTIIKYNTQMSANTQMGTDAQMGDISGYERIIIPELKPDLQNKKYWSYYYIISGKRNNAGLITFAHVPQEQKAELRRIILKNHPMHMYALLYIIYT